MKTVKFNLDDKILESLEKLADGLGLKVNAYIQLVLGQHAREKEHK